ncbi:MAG: hypothetical protein DMD42_11825 [Gemmatimonadetes bacterium]|nr:MAG: hypothetical protein DMD42_11825 [Gemmatimonadota bacterium]
MQPDAAVGVLRQPPAHARNCRLFARHADRCRGGEFEHHPVCARDGRWSDYQRSLPLPGAAPRPVRRPARPGNDPGHVRGPAARAALDLSGVTFEHVFADLGGIPANRLTDPQGLAGLLLAAANAAGLNPANPPVVTLGPRGVSAALVCHGGHVAMHGVPEAGLCFADLAGVGGALPQRGLEVIIKRLGAREVRTDARRRGPVTQAIHPEGS